MVFKLNAFSLQGIGANFVQVEVSVVKGLFRFDIVGLTNKTIQESKERIQNAIESSGFTFPINKIIVNLSPAHLAKRGSHFDLPIACGLLLDEGHLETDLSDYLLLGELSLAGELNSVEGIVIMLDEARKRGIKKVIVPYSNLEEASLVKDLDVVGCKNLKEVVSVLQNWDSGRDFLGSSVGDVSFKSPVGVVNPENITGKNKTNSKSVSHETLHKKIDFAEINGQYKAKRILELAAVGGHNVLLSGSPGVGKSMLAKAYLGLLQELEYQDALEVTKIYSAAGLTVGASQLITTPPFRSPHHTASFASIIGGGNFVRPGEVSLAHKGVLFLDEFPEFPQRLIELLRQPMEDKLVSVSRANTKVTYPADFQVIATMNPCKCGYLNDPTQKCECSAFVIERYKSKISGPILDRFDIKINLSKPKSYLKKTKAESTQEVRERIEKVREIKKGLGSEIYTQSGLYENLKRNNLEEFAESLVRKQSLSMRAFIKLLRLSQTIALFEHRENIQEDDIYEAISYVNKGS